MSILHNIYHGCLICISGIDGSGKSTASRGVVDRVSGTANVTYVWGRYTPILLYPFYVVAQRLLGESNTESDYEKYSETKSRATTEHPFLAQVYLIILIVDYWLQIQFKIGTRLVAGQTVICDRYVFDTVIVDVANEFGYSPEETNDFIDAFLAFVPRPEVTFLIDTPPAVSLKRKDDIPQRAYVEERRGYYANLPEEFAMVTIDGTLPPEEIQQRIIDTAEL